MANLYPGSSGLHNFLLPAGQLVDIGTASIVYAPIPFRGSIRSVRVAVSAATTTTNTVITIKVSHQGAAAVTIGTITCTFTGSAAGSVYEAVMTGTETDRSVIPGDTLICDSDGGTDAVAIGKFTAVIRRP